MNNFKIYKNIRSIKKTQSLLLASILLISFASVGLFTMIDADHNTITKNLASGSQSFSFRDITNLDTISSISGIVNGSSTLSLVVTDADADLDTSVLDFVYATAISTSSGSTTARTILTETDVNSAEFTGVITLSSDTTTGSILEANAGDTLQFFYESHPLSLLPEKEFVSQGEPIGLARLSATVDLDTSGDVSVTDVILTANDIANFPFRSITHIAEISFSNGATQTSGTDMEVIFSYANGLFNPGDDPALLQMYYREPGLGWKVIRVDDFPTLGFDSVAKTITSDPDQAGFLPGFFDGVTQGQFILAFDTGGAGGGGGGLVSPGLVVNALAGIGGIGGGGSGGSAPLTSLNQLISSTAVDLPEEVIQMIVNHDSSTPLLPMAPDSFEDFDFPLVINDQGFVLGGFTSTLQTQTLKTDTPVIMKFTIYETQKIQHFSIYMNLRDTNDSIRTSDTQILYNDGKDLKIIDPNGFFSNAKITVIEGEEDFKKYVIVEMTFAKEMETSHIITRIWDPNLFSRDTHILDAIKIIPEEPEFVPIPQATEEVQVEELTSQEIPKWVKSNAEWWVENQIDDESFVAGIQYLINNGIMYIPNTEPVNSVTEIPDWIKNNAQWWVDNQISDDDFVKAMEWLVTNGVISIE